MRTLTDPCGRPYLRCMASAEADGWISAKVDDLRVHVRVGLAGSAATGDARVVITDLLVSGEDITTDTLRSIHPARLLAAVDASAGAALPTVLASRPDLAVATDSLSASNGLRVLASRRRADDDVALGELRSRATASRSAKRKRLGRPDGGDDFYRRLADAYRSAAAESGRPAMVLAEENDVPVGSVRRWVLEARRRGHLAPTTQGKAY